MSVNRPVWEALLLSDAGNHACRGFSDKRGRLLIEIDVVAKAGAD